MEPNEDGMKAIQNIVAETFVKVHQDLETILASADVPSAAEDGSEQLPELQLGHGRTYSESDEYFNELCTPVGTLPEAVLDVPNSRTIAEAAAAEAAGGNLGVMLMRKYATSDSDKEASYGKPQPGNAESFEPTASGLCTVLDTDTVSPPVRPVLSSTLSYEQLLDRAIAGMDPKLQQMSNNMLNRSSSKTSIDRQLSSSGRRSSGSNSGGGSMAARPSSRGKTAAAPDAETTYKYSWNLQSKFPASSSAASKRSAGGGPSDGDNSRSVRIFKQGSGPAMQLLGELQEKPLHATAGEKAISTRSSTDNQGSRRSNSAPRAAASVERHVQRMYRSPRRRASSEGPSAGGTAELQAKSNPFQTLSYIERMYVVGKEKQFKRMHQSQQRSVSPDSVRLSEQDWNRVTARLYNDARQKEERMRVRRARAEEEVEAAAGGPTVPDRLHSIHAQQSRSSGGGRYDKRSGGGAPSADFYRRQQAAWRRREERIEAGKRRPSIDSEDEKECTFKPEISAASKQLCPHRSVDELFKWEDHKRMHVWQQCEDKADHETDGYTWIPEISQRSRRLALQKYAVSPDDKRPWTKSPRHTSAPPRQASPPRQPSPQPRSIYSASYSVPLGIHSDANYSYSTPGQLRHSTAGPLMNSGSPASASSAYVQTRQSPYAEPAAATTGRVVVQSMNSANSQLKHAEASTGQSNFTVWDCEQLRMQNASPLLPGVVMGIPVEVMGIPMNDSPAVVAPAALPEDAVAIQMQQLQDSPGAKALLPVAPGDGVAFISLAAIRTCASHAAAAAAGPVASAAEETQAEVGLEAGTPLAGAETWQSAERVRTSHDDSAASTPLKRHYSAAVASKTATAARVFRDDSAGGMHVPARKISTGGSYFRPVVSTQKALPQSRPKQQDMGAGARLQPSLSDATRAALELSILGLEGSSQYDVTAAAAKAAAQQVPAYYVAMDYPATIKDSYSARYAYSKADAGKGGTAAFVEDPVEAGKKTAHAEWQQRQAAAAGNQHYSTAQLLNAWQRSSSAGMNPVSAEPSNDSEYAIMEAPAAAVATGELIARAATSQGSVTCQINQEPSAQLMAEQTVVEPGQLQELLAKKAEGMMSHTQSVPYELNVSPRSRVYLNSSAEGKPAHQLMALISREADAIRSTTHANEGDHTVLRPAAGSPCLPDSRTSSPAVSSHNLLAVAGMQHGQAAACGTSKLCMKSSAAPASHASCVGVQQEGVALHFPDTQDEGAVIAIEGAEKAAEQAATGTDDDVAEGVLVKPTVTVAAAEGEAVSVADMCALLFDPAMTPSDKARKMQAMFKKTMIRHDIPLNSLEQTITAMVCVTGATDPETVPVLAPTSNSTATSTPASPCAAHQAMVPAAATTAASPAVASTKQLLIEPAAADPYQGESIQDLLAHMNELEATAASATATEAHSSCSSHGGHETPCGAVMNPSPKADAAAGSNSNSGVPARPSYAAVAMPRLQSGSGSGGSSSSPGRAMCRITQWANVNQSGEFSRDMQNELHGDVMPTSSADLQGTAPSTGSITLK